MDPERIGPYRLEGRLGAGGMGVVYAAWDERLERRVAVKRVRPEGADDPRLCERLRREARAAARISHPAVVQVFDLVEGEDGDWIVLEHVEGRTLADRLRDGPLGLARALPLARQITEGLAEAHGQGVLHRDLKTENVIVTPAGHGKILDFGLARRLGPTDAGAPLTVDGGVAGTHRAMSPEQANGLDLDPRSDLFSLGVLLYETVTGASPFTAPTPVEVLHRVCTHQPPPAAERNPAVPEELSALLAQLLQKDRELRPRSASEVADRLGEIHAAWLARGSGGSLARVESEPTVAAGPRPAPVRRSLGRRLALPGAAVLLLAALAAFLWRAVPREPLYVAVAEPEVGVGRGKESSELAAAATRSSLLGGLAALDGIAPLEGGASPSPRSLAHALAADEVLASRLDCGEQECRVTVTRLLGSDGRLLWTESFEAPLEDPRLLATAARAALRRGYAGHGLRPGAPDLDVRIPDYARFLRLAEAVRSGDGGSAAVDRLLAALEAVRRGSPRFLEAYLLEAEVVRNRFFDSRDPADLDRAFQRLREARALAPGDPRPLAHLAGLALESERLDEAEASLRELEGLTPGDAQILARRALLAERRGRREEALSLLRAAARRRPSRQNLLILANLEIRLGETAAARETLAGMLGRFPADPEAESLLAQLELLSGDPERAAALYAGLARRSPGYAELSNLGLAQLLLGRPPDAAESFRKARALAPRNAVAVLNLADAEFLAGRQAEAGRLYGEVLSLTEQDPAAVFWQTLTVRAQALAHLGRAREAVAAVQQALQLAPDNPQVAYEAALVFALVGDRASAEVQAERALAQGVEPRWFGFPWFDGLRGSIRSAGPRAAG